MRLQLGQYHSEQTTLFFAPGVIRQSPHNDMHLLQMKHHLKACQNVSIGSLYAIS